MAAQSGGENPVIEVAEPVSELESLPVRPAVSRYALVENHLRKTPYEFEFFQAVRLLERLMPDRFQVGRLRAAPGKEVVRFSAHASFPFPASQIQDLQWRDSAAPVMVINFMGLCGPSGVMPLYYTDMLITKIRQKDTGLKDFLDIFNHRIVSLFYQAWEKYRFAIGYERRTAEQDRHLSESGVGLETSFKVRGERDGFSHHLLDLIGLGTPHLQTRLEILDESLMFYSGLLSLHARPAAALRRILWDYFDVPVEVEQFIGAWHGLEEPDQCIFDRSSDASEQLGLGAIVGDEIWNQQSGVRIKIGPVGLEKYLDFLPSGTAYRPLKSLAKFIARGQIDFELQLILKKEEVPALELGVGIPGRLGWTSWAKTVPKTEDAGDTIFSI